jgi:Mrp family chromosome partitioning ATPase
MYEAFVTRLRETQDQDVIQNPDARVISRAPVPTSPSSPKRMLIVGASIPAGLLLGLLAALLAERLAAPLSARAAPATAPHRAPARATTHRGPPVLARLDNIFDPRAADAVIDWPASAFAQTAASLLQRIRNTARGSGATVIAVTAPEWGAKTAVAVALARTASKARLRVAIIDADLTHPAVAQAMRLGPARAGLMELLTGRVPFAGAGRRDPRSHVFAISPVQPRHDPAVVLASAKMAELIAYLRQTCDVVIVDAPPLFASEEMRSLGRLSDTLLVVGRGETLARGAAARAIRSIADSRAAPIGLVLSR